MQAVLKWRLPLVLRGQHQTWCLQHWSSCWVAFHCVCTVAISDVLLPIFSHTCVRIRKMITSMLVPASPVHPATLFDLVYQNSKITVEAEWEVSFTFSLSKPLSLHAAAAAVLLMMYAQGSYLWVNTLCMDFLRQYFCTIMVTLIVLEKPVVCLEKWYCWEWMTWLESKVKMQNAANDFFLY